MKISHVKSSDHPRIYKNRDSGKVVFSQLPREARPGEDALQGERQGSTSHSPPRRASRDCISPPPKGGGHGPWANHGSLAKLVARLLDWSHNWFLEAPWPVAPPFGGEYGRERLAGVAPDGPPLTLGFVLVSFTGKFTDILGLIWLVN